MMGSFNFSISEGVKGIKRAKLASFNASGAIAVSILALGLFVFVMLKMQNVMNSIESRIELEAFFEDGLSQEQIHTAQTKIQNLDGVQSVEYITQEQALAEFKENFGLELKTILDENPLPPSLRIKPTREAFFQGSISGLVNQIEKINGIIEVVNNREVFSILHSYRNSVIAVILIVGVILAVISIFLVTNSIKISIVSRKNVIELMRIVGARKGFIRRPFILEGFLLGLFGGAAGLGLFAASLTAFAVISGFAVSIPIEFVYGLPCAGAGFGLAGSIFSTSRLFKNIL